VAQRRADLILGVVIAALGAWALSMALDLSMFTKTHTPGPGLFPTLVSSFMLALGVLLAVLCARDLVAARREVPSSEDAEARPPTDATLVDAGPSQPRRIGRAGAVFACYVVTMPLMSILGFVPAAAVLIVLVLFGVERRRDWRALAAAVLIPVAAFYLFVHLLTIQLPTGLLDLGPLST
jgi:Tripartite tricarboxylate transporter TctB family